MTGVAVEDARAVLIGRLIDDAGLFPPARKPMPHAIADHNRARSGSDSFMLGRFVCPASRLGELDGQDVPDVAAVLDEIGDDWLASVRSGLAHIARAGKREQVTAIEVALPHGALEPSLLDRCIDEVRKHDLDHRLVLFEIRSRSRAALEDALAAIASRRNALALAAKYRCGGLSASDFPPDELLAAFLHTAHELAVPFKLTAGLHHPFRTPEPRLDVLQHGFVNVLTAVALAPEDPLAAVGERDASAFELDAGGLSWRGRRAGADELVRARDLFLAVGSCGFEDAVQDLREQGVLPLSTAR